MVKLLLAAKIFGDNAAFHPWMQDCHTPRFLREVATQCFSEVMVKLLLAAIIPKNNAAYHPWTNEFHTVRFLQEGGTQCFSEAMVKLLLAAGILMEDAASHSWMKEFRTARFLQEVATQCFSEVMVKLLLAVKMIMGSAAFHPWTKEFYTARFPQDIATQCFSEVMVKLCGQNYNEQCSIPPLDEGISYSQVSAGRCHTVLLRSDGRAVACGSNYRGQCSIPPLDEGISYSQVSAGLSHTVLLRIDGQAVACGDNSREQCSIPSLRSWRDWFPFGFAFPSYNYISDFTTSPVLGKDRVVQVDFLLEGDAGVILTCVGLDGLEVLRLKAQKSDGTVDVCSRVARELNTNAGNLRMVLPDARLLSTICKAHPFGTLSDVISV